MSDTRWESDMMWLFILGFGSGFFAAMAFVSVMYALDRYERERR